MAKERINKVYTRTGDQGETGLGRGHRVAKDSARIEAYGTVDELDAAIGLALAGGLEPPLPGFLERIQSELFTVGSDLCMLPEDKATYHPPQIEPRHVERIESDLDRLNAELKPLKEFVLRGGHPGAAALHLACTVCRRAERRVVSLAHHEPVGENVIPYLNRLGDLLFVMARAQNHKTGADEPAWDKNV